MTQQPTQQTMQQTIEEMTQETTQQMTQQTTQQMTEQTMKTTEEIIEEALNPNSESSGDQIDTLIADAERNKMIGATADEKEDIKGKEASEEDY